MAHWGAGFAALEADGEEETQQEEWYLEGAGGHRGAPTKGLRLSGHGRGRVTLLFLNDP